MTFNEEVEQIQNDLLARIGARSALEEVGKVEKTPLTILVPYPEGFGEIEMMIMGANPFENTDPDFRGMLLEVSSISSKLLGSVTKPITL